jgi:hypothetical protein
VQGRLNRSSYLQLIDTIRRYDRSKRKVVQDQALDDSSARLEEFLAAVKSSPSQRASNHEQLLRLAQALTDLPENQGLAVSQSPPLGLIQETESTSRSSSTSSKRRFRDGPRTVRRVRPRRKR